MKVGCVKEIKNREYRVGLIPDNVKSYVNAGHQVLIERGAGLGSGFTDQEYEKAGAVLKDTAKEVWDGVDMMVKVKEGLFQRNIRISEKTFFSIPTFIWRQTGR